MRNIKLTESEWRYIKGALIHSGDFVDSWEDDVKIFSKEWDRKNKLFKRAQSKIFNAKKEVA